MDLKVRESQKGTVFETRGPTHNASESCLKELDDHKDDPGFKGTWAPVSLRLQTTKQCQARDQLPKGFSIIETYIPLYPTTLTPKIKSNKRSPLNDKRKHVCRGLRYKKRFSQAPQFCRFTLLAALFHRLYLPVQKAIWEASPPQRKTSLVHQRRQSARRNGPARTQLGGAAQKQGESGMAESVHVFEQKILVIMAGDEHPTYLATPVSSLGEGFEEVFGKGDDNRENSQKIDEQVCDLVATSTTTPLENEGALESRQSSNL
ncbi:uncharacterized protein LOC129318291 [Prosopis cineraria]|uniref:uncharacterized protein LOC129318291 n=1 Tax=Prosopis cineraria TaxID=364024 RepID=UPI00240FFC6E|nr:uncharacterized protein LOC129318291 [Prosopis cineraria]